MSNFADLAFRQEVQFFLRSCEYLLSASTTPHSPPFTQDELEIIKYYVAEVEKLLAVSIKT